VKIIPTDLIVRLIAAPRQNALNVERVGDDVYRLDRFGRRNTVFVGPGINDPGAIDSGVILDVKPIHVE
jgi:hypothetical protein